MRKKDANWGVTEVSEGHVSNPDAQLSVLMDLRDELKLMRPLLGMIKDMQQQQLRYQRRIDARLAKELPLPRGKKYE